MSAFNMSPMYIISYIWIFYYWIDDTNQNSHNFLLTKMYDQNENQF